MATWSFTHCAPSAPEKSSPATTASPCMTALWRAAAGPRNAANGFRSREVSANALAHRLECPFFHFRLLLLPEEAAEAVLYAVEINVVDRRDVQREGL